MQSQKGRKKLYAIFHRSAVDGKWGCLEEEPLPDP